MKCSSNLLLLEVTNGNECCENAVKSHFKALGLYNFIRGFGWACKRGGGGGGGGVGGLYPGGIKKCFGNDEIKRISETN